MKEPLGESPQKTKERPKPLWMHSQTAYVKITSSPTSKPEPEAPKWVTGQAFPLLVAVSCTCCHASTSALSTLSSSREVTSEEEGDLILRGASRLDAFSVYPFRAWLPGYALGSPAGAPAARPARSSRTKASSLQISCAHAG